MLKMFVTKAVKAAWENAGSIAPVENPPPGEVIDAWETEATEQVAISPADLGIELPYYPGQGTACGSACRCSWEIDVRWSDRHGATAIFATWKTAGDGTACAECLARAQQWNDEFICLYVEQ
ncbi:MAG TPA: hypothetical protein PK819_07265 [Thermomicrobiales bacterium]|nr:hypothetical protein [Thermomicrobiales bacterium]